MAGKFELKKGKNDHFTFNLKASNGQVILTSEQYKTKTAAMGGIDSVKKNAANDAAYERKTSSKNEPYFVLKAVNGQIIGKSEMYSSSAAMENGLASVRKNGPDAVIEDLIV